MLRTPIVYRILQHLVERQYSVHHLSHHSSVSVNRLRLDNVFRTQRYLNIPTSGKGKGFPVGSVQGTAT